MSDSREIERIGTAPVAGPIVRITAQKLTDSVKQLTKRDMRQILNGFGTESYEMVVTFVWIKAMGTLKRELASLGGEFIGEMLRRPDLSEAASIEDSITDSEAIILAEELGIITGTESLRLRHSLDLVGHFAKLDPERAELEPAEMTPLEALMCYEACVVNILGRDHIQMPEAFIEFRKKLESQVFSSGDAELSSFLATTYYIKKVILSVLLSATKKYSGARLENALGNLVVIAPLIWGELRKPEKYQVGQAYAEAHNEGNSEAASGIKRALVRVKGFDYVPETLRSSTFTRAAKQVLEAHEGWNNFYNEIGPITALDKLGTSIPMPAFPVCASAILSVYLGNSYGYSFDAAAIARRLLKQFNESRWEYYLNECLPGDLRILDKLDYAKPLRRWFDIVGECSLENIQISGNHIKRLLQSSVAKDERGAKTAAEKQVQASREN